MRDGIIRKSMQKVVPKRGSRSSNSQPFFILDLDIFQPKDLPISASSSSDSAFLLVFCASSM